MVKTNSNMVNLKTPAPDFNLLDTTSDQYKTLQELKSEIATVIFFICNHCPFVININPKLVEVAQKYQALGVNFIAISANDHIAFPEDSPEKMTIHAQECNYNFPYLHDETQEIAMAYKAACTPDFFIYDHNLELAYRGRFDDSTPGNGKEVTGYDLSLALDDIINAKEIIREQSPSMGCNIKWKEE